MVSSVRMAFLPRRVVVQPPVASLPVALVVEPLVALVVELPMTSLPVVVLVVVALVVELLVVALPVVALPVAAPQRCLAARPASDHQTSCPRRNHRGSRRRSRSRRRPPARPGLPRSASVVGLWAVPSWRSRHLRASTAEQRAELVPGPSPSYVFPAR